MARPNSSSSRGTSTTTTLALSSLHTRLEALNKENQWLLQQIKRKRTELKNFVEQMRALATDIFHRGTPVFKRLAEFDREIHTLFDEIFTTRKFGKKTYNDIQGIYLSLQMGGIISPKLDDDDDDEPELDELFETDGDDNDSSKEREDHQQNQQAQEETGTRPDESRKIRQTFLRLAEIFHPDRVRDNETQRRHTEIMKEINRAYQEGDLARLLEIERQHQEGESIESNSEDDLSRRCNRLEEENEFLKKQYENLKRELRLVKNTPEGEIVSDCRKARREGIDPIAYMIEQVESQIKVIEQIRNFVKDFREQKITIKEFLAGPASLRQMNRRMMEELLEQMFSDFI
jgi:chaperonin cofactor prefoldin